MTLQFSIPSELAAGQKVQQAILDLVQKLNYHTEAYFAIRMSLEEGVINAIKHGNKFDPAKQVKVVATITPKQAKVVIEDQGAGFKLENVPDPTAEENLEKCSGRGILLMRSYMHSAKYSKGGRRLTLVRKNTTEAVPAQ